MARYAKDTLLKVNLPMNPLDPLTAKKIISLPNQFGEKFGEHVGESSTLGIKPFRHFLLFIEYHPISWYLSC